jgi:hypothetical protein
MHPVLLVRSSAHEVQEVKRMIWLIKRTTWLTSGGLSFWLPVIVIFSINRLNVRMLLPNVLAVLSASLCYAVYRWLYRGERLAIWMLIGLYVLGPILMSTANSFANGGFLRLHGWQDIRWLVLSCVFPPIELLVAGASGLLPSLLVVTAILGFAATDELTSTPK